MPNNGQNNGKKPGKWIESPQGRTAMDRLARSVRDAVVSRNLPLSFINKDPFASRTDSDLIEEIRSELVLFFLENAGHLEKHLMCGDRNFPAYMKQQFLSQWLSKARTPARDPYRYLYKRAQDLLRLEKDFFTHIKKGQSTAFSKRPQNRAIPPLVDEDLRSIPFPPEYHNSPRDNAVKTKREILGLAGYFWDQVHTLWEQEPVWVDIRDFITWIAHNVPLRRASGDTEFPAGGYDPLESPEEALRSGETYWDPDGVKSWALIFFHQTDPKKLQIFQLFHQENKTLREIALKMGYKGSSGPKYAVDHVTAALQFFLRDLPWLSPDDLNQEAFALFFDTLFTLLKNSATAP